MNPYHDKQGQFTEAASAVGHAVVAVASSLGHVAAVGVKVLKFGMGIKTVVPFKPGEKLSREERIAVRYVTSGVRGLI